MREPCAVVIALVGNEHLCLLLQPAEGVGMDDPVAVALEIRPRGARRLGMKAAPRPVRIAGEDGPWRRGEWFGHDGAFHIGCGGHI